MEGIGHTSYILHETGSTILCMVHVTSIQAKLSVVAAERDSAVREMRTMAEQCQRVAGEFDSMAQHCDMLIRENKRVYTCICTCSY